MHKLMYNRQAMQLYSWRELPGPDVQWWCKICDRQREMGTLR